MFSLLHLITVLGCLSANVNDENVVSWKILLYESTVKCPNIQPTGKCAKLCSFEKEVEFPLSFLLDIGEIVKEKQ